MPTLKCEVLQRLSFSTKLWLALALMWAALLAVSVGSVLDTHRRVLAERLQGLNSILDVAVHIADSYQERVARGELSESDAKKAVLLQWDLMRFQDGGYVYVLTQDYTPLPSRGRPSLVSKGVVDVTDAMRRRPNVELAPLTLSKGTGHGSTNAMPQDRRTLTEAISAARTVPSWNWLVGTRVYVEDVNAVRRKLLITRLMWALSVGLISTLLIVLTVSNIQQRMGRDHLTGLLNRKGLDRRMTSVLANVSGGERRLALFLIDLDGFKAVNDTYGHASGDALLSAFSSRIQAAVRSSDAVARFGGDEFAVIAQGISSVAVAERIAQSIVSTACEPYLLDNHSVTCRASVGIALHTSRHRISPHELFLQADAALYDAKRAGKSRFAIFATAATGPSSSPNVF